MAPFDGQYLVLECWLRWYVPLCFICDAPIVIFVITVVEMGDEIESLISEKTLLLINHQSTSDVPLIMSALDGHEGACRNIMWIMDRMFLRTNFGIVSWFHKDFFISSVSRLNSFSGFSQ